MMLAFLFNLVGSSAKLWEAGNKKIEAAQAARIGLNFMAIDLKNAFSGNMTSYTSNGTAINNIAPFMALGNNTTTAMGLEDSVGKGINANGSQQIAGVTLTNNSSIPDNEFGYMAVFVNDPGGIDPMIGDRYYLVKKVDNVSSTGGDFYFRGNSTATWQNSSDDFYPIVDNCIRLKLEYYGNSTSSTGTPGWTSTWAPTDRLPLGVLVTLSVLDSKTAIKVNALKNGTALSTVEITNGLSSSPSATLSPVERLIAQGSVTMSRFIPFNSN